MAITFVSSSSGHAGTTVSAEVPRPSGIQDGDVLLSIFAMNVSPGVDPIPPSGFTTHASTRWSAYAPIILGAKVVTSAATEPATYSFAVTGSGQKGGIVAAYRGVDTASIFDTTASTAEMESSPIDLPSITTATDNALLIAIGASWGGATLGAPSGMVLQFSNSLNANPGIINFWSQVVTVPGATGIRQFTSSYSSSGGILTALRPAGDAPTARPWTRAYIVE